MFSEGVQAADSVRFWDLWGRLKGKIGALQRLPGEIEEKKGEVILVMKKPSVQKLPSDHPTRVQLRAALSKLLRMKDEANTIGAKIAQYLPDWRKAAGVRTGLGAIPIVLGVAALGALAFVGIKGLALLKEYAQESSVIESLKSKTLTLEEARELIKVTKPAPLIEAGFALGAAVPLALGALAAFWFFGSGPGTGKGRE